MSRRIGLTRKNTGTVEKTPVREKRWTRRNAEYAVTVARAGFATPEDGRRAKVERNKKPGPIVGRENLTDSRTWSPKRPANTSDEELVSVFHYCPNT